MASELHTSHRQARHDLTAFAPDKVFAEKPNEHGPRYQRSSGPSRKHSVAKLACPAGFSPQPLPPGPRPPRPPVLRLSRDTGFPT